MSWCASEQMHVARDAIQAGDAAQTFEWEQNCGSLIEIILHRRVLSGCASNAN